MNLRPARSSRRVDFVLSIASEVVLDAGDQIACRGPSSRWLSTPISQCSSRPTLAFGSLAPARRAPERPLAGATPLHRLPASRWPRGRGRQTFWCWSGRRCRVRSCGARPGGPRSLTTTFKTQTEGEAFRLRRAERLGGGDRASCWRASPSGRWRCASSSTSSSRLPWWRRALSSTRAKRARDPLDPIGTVLGCGASLPRYGLSTRSPELVEPVTWSCLLRVRTAAVCSSSAAAPRFPVAACAW